jgi:hypothetical protein
VQNRRFGPRRDHFRIHTDVLEDVRDFIPVNNLNIVFMNRSVVIHNKEENILRYILKHVLTSLAVRNMNIECGTRHVT